jgi:hypothetical protein
MSWHFKKHLNLALCLANFVLYFLLQVHSPEEKLMGVFHIVAGIMGFIAFMACKEMDRLERENKRENND